MENTLSKLLLYYLIHQDRRGCRLLCYPPITLRLLHNYFHSPPTLIFVSSKIGADLLADAINLVSLYTNYFKMYYLVLVKCPTT